MAFPEALQRHVTDEAGLLEAGAEARLESLLVELEQKSSVEVAVVTLRSLEGRQIDEAAVDLFQKWGIGEKGKDNGVLFLSALEDRKTRIEVGYGLEPVIPDGLAGRILDTEVLPYFRQNQYQQGVIQGTLQIARLLAQNAGVTLSGDFQAGPNRPRPRSLVFSALVFLVFMILLIRHPWLFWMLMASRGGGRGGWPGGGFGGGFGGFGGGMSGGGGASRGW